MVPKFPFTLFSLLISLNFEFVACFLSLCLMFGHSTFWWGILHMEHCVVFLRFNLKVRLLLCQTSKYLGTFWTLMFSHTISHEQKWEQIIKEINIFPRQKIFSICRRVHLIIFQIMKKVHNNKIEYLDIHPSTASLVIDFEHFLLLSLFTLYSQFHNVRTLSSS